MSRHRRAQRSSLRRPRPFSKVPGGYPMLPRSKRQGALLQHWRSRPPSHPEHGRTTQGQLSLGRSLHSRKGDRAGLLPPSDTRRRRRQQLVERRPALSVLRLVYTTTPGLKSTRLHQDPSAVSGLRVQAPVSGLPLHCKRPPGLGPSLRTTPLQNPAHAATYGSWPATSDKGL
jgi:hypothetical protein